jgi:hypothetical protein
MSREKMTFSDFFPDNELMTVSGLPIQKTADDWESPIRTASKHFERASIKPILKEDIYPEFAVEAIREAHKGRPRKPKLGNIGGGK